ncbi:hypothetical protein [Actinomadura vinacea]
MTESPPRPEMPSDDLNAPQLIPRVAGEGDASADAARPFMMPPAPLPVAPWWASSTPDPTPPPSVTGLRPAPPPPTVIDPIPVRAAPPPDPAAIVAGPPPPGGEPPPPLPAPGDIMLVPAPAPSPEAARVAPPPPAPAAPPEPPPAPPAAPDAFVDQVISTGPQHVWHATDQHWTPRPPAPPAPAPPRPAPERKSKTGLMAAVAVGVGVLAAAVTAVLVVVAGGDDVPLRKVAAAGTAGGLRKDPSAPAMSSAYPFVIAAIRAGGVEKAATARGVYRDQVNGAQSILFLGGTAAIGDPAAFLKKARPSTVLTAAKTPPGKAGGQISCGTFAVLRETHLFCAWATENSFGFVASNEPAAAARPNALAPLTLRMRTDLEKRTS